MLGGTEVVEPPRSSVCQKYGVREIVGAGVAVDLAESWEFPLSGAASTDYELPVTEEELTSGVIPIRTKKREPLTQRSALLTLTRSRPREFASIDPVYCVAAA